jgi:hypothetical protein
MVREKINLSNLNNLNRFDCEEYLGYLRHSLLSTEQKSVKNDIRLHIFKLEERLSHLGRYQSLTQRQVLN